MALPAGPQVTAFNKPTTVSGTGFDVVRQLAQALQSNAPANEIRPATMFIGCDGLPSLNFLNGTACDATLDGTIVLANPATGTLLTTNLPRAFAGTNGSVGSSGSFTAPATSRFVTLAGVATEEDGVGALPSGGLHVTIELGGDGHEATEEDSGDGSYLTGVAHVDFGGVDEEAHEEDSCEGDGLFVPDTLLFGEPALEEDLAEGDLTVPGGAFPVARLLKDGDTLYGTTREGGAHGKGIAFSVGTDGSAFTQLRRFAGPTADGDTPLGGFVKVSDKLYSTTRRGGAGFNAPAYPGGLGCVYKLGTDGGGFGLVKSMTCGFVVEPNTMYTNPSGFFPLNDLLYDAGVVYLFGTSSFGGADNDPYSAPLKTGGCVFKVKTDGTGFAQLVEFTSHAHGATPTCALVSDGTYLYGTLSPYNTTPGCIFRIKPDGTGFSIVRDFASDQSEGWVSWSTLSYVSVGGAYGDILFGTALAGTGNKGIVFSVKTDGTGFTILRTFAGGTTDGDDTGASWLNGPSTLDPVATGLAVYGAHLDGTTPMPLLFGTTRKGGAYDKGTVYSMWADGSNFAILHDFIGPDGESPEGTLIFEDILGGGVDLDHHAVYGTTKLGGANGKGTVFSIVADGSGFTLLHSFTG